MLYLCLFIAFVAIFGASFFVYAYGSDFLTGNKEEKQEKYAAFPLIILFSVAMMIVSFLWKGEALLDAHFYDVLLMFCGATAISALGLFSKKRLFLYLMLLLSVASCLFFEPNQDIIVYGEIPQIYAKVVLGAAWFLLAAVYPIFSRVDGLLGLYTILVMCGVFVFYMSGGVSQFELFAALFLTAALIPYVIFNFYPAEVKFSESGAAATGFVSGWILQRCCMEGMSLPTEILLSWVWVEAASGILSVVMMKKEKYKTALWVKENGDEDNSLSAIGFCIKMQPVMIVLAFMQMHILVAPAIPIFAILIILWGMGKFAYSDRKSFSEVNAEIVAGVKEGYKDFIETWRKLKK